MGGDLWCMGGVVWWAGGVWIEAYYSRVAYMYTLQKKKRIMDFWVKIKTIISAKISDILNR